MPTDSYILSNIDGTKVQLTFNNQKPVSSGTVEPGAQFILTSVMPWLNPQTKITPGEFKQKFGSFTFVFESPQKSYSIRFNSGDVDALIRQSDKAMQIESAPKVIFRDQ